MKSEIGAKRGDGDNAAGSICFQSGVKFLARVQHAFEIGVEERIPLGGAYIESRFTKGGSSSVNQYVNSSEILKNALTQVADGPAILNIACVHESTPAAVLDFPANALQKFGAAGRRHDIGAMLRKSERNF